jgi:hypothetical protein
MERRFSIEAKSFRFSTKEGSSLFRLEERRKKFVGYIFVSLQCSSWLIDTVEAACLVKENIAKSFREGDKALMVHGGDNKAGRFLEVAVFAEGGRKGGLWLPEGRDGRGWRRFADELRSLLASPVGGLVESDFRPSSSSKSTKLAEAGVSGVCSKVRTFAEILKSKPRSCIEKTNDGIDLPREAAGSVKMMRGSDAEGWVEHLLGFVQLGLGRVAIGLLEGILSGPDELPIRKRIRAVLKRLKASKDGPSLVPTSTGRVSGFRRVKLGLKGIGRSFKSKKAAMSGPTCSNVEAKLASEVRLPSSTQRTHAESKLASEIRLGESGAEISESERVAGKSPSGCLGESPPVSTSPVFEVCVDASDGDGLSVGDVPISDLVCVRGSNAESSVNSLVCDRGSIIDGSAKSFSVDVSVSSEGSDAGVKDSVDSPSTEAFHVKAAGDGSADVANRRDHELGLMPGSPSCRDHEFTSPGGLESMEIGSGSVSSLGLGPASDTQARLGNDLDDDGPVGDGSDVDLGLTVSQLGLIERFRKAVSVTEKNKRLMKQVEENFIRVNKGMHDGVMPAEEGEAVLAAYVRVIEEFLGEKRERAHMGLPGQRGA